jgi:hypothetical protein
MDDWYDRLDRDGFVLLSGVFSAELVRRVVDEWAAAMAAADVTSILANGGPAYGARNVLRLWPGVIRLARHPALAGPLLRVLGPTGGVVRGLYFDKPPGHSWALPWHRDRTVAVKAHGRRGVFDKPTVKAGVPHVEGPVELLAGMVTARIHLDPMTPHNGPLRVAPGSHRTGDPDADAATTLHCAAGDVLLMRPLLLHASGHTDPSHPAHRRVVHLECAPHPDLADGYDWHDFVPLRE